MSVFDLSFEISKRAVGLVIGWALLVGLCTEAYATDFVVSNASQINTAMSSASPGDTVTMTDGVWTNQQIDFAGFGTSANPITLRTQSPGGVTLNGNSTLSISGDWLVADGLNFEGGALSSGNVVEFRGNNGNATNSRLTNTAIIDYNPASINTRYFWVSLYGDSNRVDHNYFENHNHSGVTVVDWFDGSNDNIGNHRIDSNHFADRPEGNGNGWETIRIGTSTYSMSHSNDLIENNLFERTDGEIEIISNKTGSNTYRYNTFKESSGTLTLRHGNNATVEGNFFLGNGKNGSGGVRVIGEDHTLVNNYFSGLDDRADGVISLTAGVVNSPLNRYFQVKNATIAHNTLVGATGPLVTFDYLYDPVDDGELQNLLPEDVTIANNVFQSGNTIFEGQEGSGWTWEGNIAFGASLGPKAGDPGITVVDPQLSLGGDGLWRPNPGSPVVNASSGNYSSLLTDDMDGQPRIGIFDVGADEISAATIVRGPLSADDVGPDWLGPVIDPPSGGGCDSAGCAIQAEDYAEMLDPNGDGGIWTTLSVASALGGEVLKAPGGGIASTGNHDTLALFDVEFETQGTYTAYYRARGFDGSSNSMYTPDDFEVDPDNTEHLSETGLFEWTKDSQTFTIDGSNDDVPLEFRVGRREGDAEFDAFVLNLDSNLSDAELDALFDIVEELLGDYNGDDIVDGADYTVWRDTYLQLVPPGTGADGDGNGIIDNVDYGIWVTHFGEVAGGGSGAGQGSTVPEPDSLVLLVTALMACVCLRTKYSYKLSFASIGHLG